MKVAVVGLGNAGYNLHLPALAGLSDHTVVGACDADDDRRKRAAAHWPVPTYGHLDELFERARPDVLIIGTPPETHAVLCVRALERGIHVVCEKPFTATLAEADRVIAAASTAGRRVALNYEFREMPIARAVLDGVGGPGVGPLRFAQIWQAMDLPPWKEPGWRGQLLRGVLYESGIHLLDYALALFGETPEAVWATMSTCEAGPLESDTVALVTLTFSGGRLAQVTQNRLCRGDTQYFEVRADCAEASLRASFGGRARLSAGLYRSTRPHVRLEFGPAGVAWREVGDRRTALASNPREPGMLATRRLLAKTLAGFANGGPLPASAEDGRAGLAVAAACYESAAAGRRITLDAATLGRLAHVRVGGVPGG